MPNPRIRCPVLYANTTKIAEMQEHQYGMSSGREPELTSEGLLAYSDGNLVTTLTIGAVSLVGGVSFSFVDKILNAEDVDIGLPIEGGYHIVTFSVLELKWSGEVKGNTFKANITLGGGKPKIAA